MDRNTSDRRRERRRYPRYPVAVDGTLCTAGVKVPCRVHNISAGGALVEVDARLRIGDRATLEIDDLGDMIGRVVRISSTAVAIAFDGADVATDTFVGEWCTLEPVSEARGRTVSGLGKAGRVV